MTTIQTDWWFFHERRIDMAKNDMEVIEYKILKYLYESLKTLHGSVDSLILQGHTDWLS